MTGRPNLEEALLAKAARQRKQMQPWKELVDAYDALMWKRVTRRLEQRLKALRTMRLGHETLRSIGEVETKMILAREEEIESVIALPATGRALLQKMQNEHASLQAKIREKHGS